MGKTYIRANHYVALTNVRPQEADSHRSVDFLIMTVSATKAFILRSQSQLRPTGTTQSQLRPTGTKPHQVQVRIHSHV